MYPLLVSDLKETLIFSQILEKFSDIKYHEYPSSGNRVVPYGWTDRHGEVNPLTPELNPSAQRCLRRFLLGILLLEPCISLIHA
jgi:hypothetical protein